MKAPSLVIISLAGNLVLGAVFVQMRAGVPPRADTPVAVPGPAASLKLTNPPAASAEKSTPLRPWSRIESDDYRQYLANLRGVGCPDWLVRDIIVADIDDLYEKKTKGDPVWFSPWQGVNARSKAFRGQVANLIAVRREKRALVKVLLGYEWDNHDNEVWTQDIQTSLTLGFLPDEKVSQVMNLKDEYTAAAQNIREDANFILIDEDRQRLQALYEGFETEISQILNGAELEELDLRAQKDFLTANDIHFEGMTLSQGDLRQFVLMTKPFKDMARSEFVPIHPLSDAEQAAWSAAFEAKVKTFLGPESFADYERAQDSNFRSILEFSQQNNLPQTAAIEVYKIRQTTSEEADEIQKDEDLSPEERDTALQVLKTVTTRSVSSALGGAFQNYVEGSGGWLDALVQPPNSQTQKQ